MSDRDAIAELLSNYAWSMDNGDYQGLSDAFVEDSSLRIEIAGADPIGPIEPRDAIVEFIGGTTEDQQDQRRHVISNQRFESKGEDEAMVTSTLTLNVITDGVLEVKATGVYRSGVVREGDAWRIKSLTIVLDLPF